MPDGKRDITHLTSYFNLNAPRASHLALALIILGAMIGIAANLMIHPRALDLYYLLVYGGSAGIAA